MVSTKIKVIGIGGAGCNTINRLMQADIKNIELISLNTDVQDLKKKNCSFKLKNWRKSHSRIRSRYEDRDWSSGSARKYKRD